MAGQTRCEDGHIASGSLQENGYNEGFNGRLQDVSLDYESFFILKEVQIFIEDWCDHYNYVQPYNAWGYESPAPVTCFPIATPTERALAAYDEYMCQQYEYVL